MITAICDEQALLNDKCLPKHCIHKILLDSRRAGQGSIITALIPSVRFVAECLYVLSCNTLQEENFYWNVNLAISLMANLLT